MSQKTLNNVIYNTIFDEKLFLCDKRHRTETSQEFFFRKLYFGLKLVFRGFLWQKSGFSYIFALMPCAHPRRRPGHPQPTHYACCACLGLGYIDSWSFGYVGQVRTVILEFFVTLCHKKLLAWFHAPTCTSGSARDTPITELWTLRVSVVCDIDF